MENNNVVEGTYSVVTEDTNTTNTTEIKMNRAQRRAQAKMEKKRMSKIKQYIRRHPEAVKVELDEDKIQELEEKEKEANNVGDET